MLPGLEGLYVYPAYQRRGIGGMLVAEGVQRADEMGWLSYMDATSKGDGLYRKHGFEEKDRVVVGQTGKESLRRGFHPYFRFLSFPSILDTRKLPFKFE
jgi:N-acetylglutamate synthase-like GNAT family acetyltransferase